MDGGGNDIGDGLALAGSGRPLDHQGFRPRRTLSITRVCELSASTTWIRSAGSKEIVEACSLRENRSALPQNPQPQTAMSGWSRIEPSGQAFRAPDSFTIDSLAKEKKPSCMPSASRPTSASRPADGCCDPRQE